jgi:hypothetical protein
MSSKVQKCKGDHGISDRDMNIILEQGEIKRKGNEGYALAAEDLIPGYKKIILAIQTAMAEKSKTAETKSDRFAGGATLGNGYNEAQKELRAMSTDEAANDTDVKLMNSGKFVPLSEVVTRAKEMYATGNYAFGPATLTNFLDVHPSVADSVIEVLSGEQEQDTGVRKAKGSASAPAQYEGYEYTEETNRALPDTPGVARRVTDIQAFMGANPGMTLGVSQLADSGFGGVLDAVDAMFVGDFTDGTDGALWHNPITGDLELWMSSAALASPKAGAFTLRHEVGHLSEGAFGHGTDGEYSANMPQRVMIDAKRMASQDTPIGEAMREIFFGYAPSKHAEEIHAQLFAIATGPNKVNGFTPAMAKYIQGAINEAKSRSQANISRARQTSTNTQDANPEIRDNAQRSSQGHPGGTEQSPAQGNRGGASVDQSVRKSITPAVESAARRVAGATGAMIAGNTTHILKKMWLSLLSLHDIVDKYKGTVPAIGKWYEAVQNAQATRRQFEQDAEKIAAAAEKLPNGTGSVNDFISRSTFDQKWGYDPKIPGKTVVVDPATETAYNRLTDQEKAVVRAVFAHGEKMMQQRKALLTKMGVTSILKMNGELQGPYAPLKRFGNFVGVLKSKELVDAEKANNSTLAEKLKGSGQHYVVSHFDTPGQAKQFAYENNLANGGRFHFSDSFNKSEKPNEGRAVPHKVLQEVMAAMKVDPNADPKMTAYVTKMIQDMALQYMDEQHARTSGLKRQNRAGYDKDMIRSFLSHSRAEASFLSNVQHGESINSEFLLVQEQAKNDATGKREFQDVVNTVAEHYGDMLNYQETPWQDRAMALTSAWQLATSLGYHITNFMQGVMVTIPKLAADFNDYSGAWKHMMAGYKLMNDAGWGNNFDISKVKDAGLRHALQKAMDMGVLDVGMNEDLAHFESTRTGIAGVDTTSKAAKSALHKLRQMSRAVEVMNRVSSATAAYNMSMARNGNAATASEYATKILQSTQGDFSRVGSPLLLKKIPKVMAQYKKYQFMMAALYTKAYMQAFHGATAEEKAIGRRMLAFKIGHTAMAAGVIGMPLMNLVGLVMGALGADDGEPYDLERNLRKAIGDETTADLLLHGPLAYLGLDMSSKLGDDKVFSILPYGTWDISSAKGMKDTIFGLAGPSLSQAGRFADGIGAMKNGDIEKGIEKFAPKGLENAMKAFRIYNEGYTLKNGDLMVKPDDINGMALALDALGMPSTALKKMDWLRSQQYEIGQFYQDRTKAIEHDYVTAHRDNDTEAMGQAREDWMNLQQGKDNLRYLFNDSHDALKKQPLSTLLKAPQGSAKREQKLQKSAGVAG